MDKETLSNYGWIVICVMVMAVMLAFASPFGNFIAGAIKSTTQGLFDTNQNALDSAGIEIMQQEFEEMLNGPSATDSPVKFGQPYQMTMDGMLMEYVFYADGSATMWMADAMAEYMPAGSFTYTETEVILEGDPPIKISADGTYLYDPEDETFKMTVKSVSKGSPKTNTAYVADPNGLVGVTGVDIQIGTDGSITIYQNGVAGETIPASSIQWYENYYTIDGEIAGAIYPDGSKITIEGIVCVIGCTHESTIAGQSKDATCTEAGYRDATVCINCGGVVSAGTVIPALGHDYVPVTTIPTATEDGYTTYGCSRCNDSYKETIKTTAFTVTADNRVQIGYTDTTTNLVIPAVFQGEDGTWYRVNQIGEQAFQNCTSLTSVSIPDSVVNILSKAFDGCTSLTDVVFSENSKLGYIGTYAFQNCCNLKSFDVPVNVNSIGWYAFSKCTSLATVSFDKNSKLNYMGAAAFYGCAFTEFDIPDGIKTIDQLVFSHCANLTKVNIPNGVKTIGSQAFAYCAFTSIQLPTELTTIGDTAFMSCKNLKNITIPTTVTSIGSGALMDCDGLTTVTIPDGFTSVPRFLFDDCDNLIEVILPNSITSIEEYAFNDCLSLRSVNIPNGVTTIEQFAFHNCDSLITINLPENITSIGQYAFRDCDALTNITIPNKVTGLEYGMFADCTALSSVTLGTSIEYISTSAFHNCNSLVSVNIPEKVKSIGELAFYNCKKLTTITIPKNVDNIGKQAFWYCDTLRTINYTGTSAEWGKITLGSDWNLWAPATQVQCSNGAVSLK